MLPMIPESIHAMTLWSTEKGWQLSVQWVKDRGWSVHIASTIEEAFKLAFKNSFEDGSDLV